MNAKIRLKLFLLVVTASALASCNTAENAPSFDSAPSLLTSNTGMVVTANPLATEVGIAVLEAGGSAVDAAVAIESVLSLVEPQSAGLGGGGFMLHYHQETHRIDVYDGRETAPAGATSDMFLDQNGNAMRFLDAKTSGVSIGVPGMVSLLALAHQDHGLLSWNQLFNPAIAHAENGFDVSPRLLNFLVGFQRNIPDSVSEGPIDLYQYFYDIDGQPKQRLVNPEYAETLRAISANPRSFYEGDIADAITKAANAEPRAGTLSTSDLEQYEARKLEPLCADYRDLVLCGPPPPSSWVAVGMVMSMLEQAPRYLEDSPPLRDWTIFGEALRLAYADRDQYIADDEFVDVPLDGLLHPDYLAMRAAKINVDRAASKVLPGDPWTFDTALAKRYGKDSTQEVAGTTHFTVVDRQGNVVAMTASVESVFGSTRMAKGMILNNQLTDFARNPIDDQGQLLANAAAPLKRPRSSMSPTIVLDKNGEFLLSTGSPGGNSIISYTLKTLVALLDWELSPQQAVDLPNIVARGDSIRIEQDRASADLINTLHNYGFNVTESQGENSGLSVIMRMPDGHLEGGADYRREGTIGVPIK